MSVQIVHEANIDAALTFLQNGMQSGQAYTWDHICYLANVDRYDWKDSATKIGQLIWDLNAKSYNERYALSAHIEQVIPGDLPYAFRNRKESAIQVIKCIDFILYQCDNAKDYKESIAYKVLTAIRDNAISSLPGYDQAKWGIS